MSSLKQQENTLHRTTLSKKWQDHCTNLPESGMGYQKVNCKVNKEGKEVIMPAIVLNSLIIESVEPIQSENILDITMS
jgi:hypothetical protein